MASIFTRGHAKLKSSIWLYLIISGVIWALWSLSGASHCEVVYRFAAPVRGAAWVTRSIAGNWVTDETKDQLLVYSAEADKITQSLIERTFYGSQDTCGVSP